MEDIKKILNKIKDNGYKDIEKEINLHIHTTSSDGSLTPDEAIAYAKSQGYKYFSITDHNTFDGYKKIDYKNIEGLITGIEFDCWYKGVIMHLLCYGIPVECEEMKEFLAKTKAETQKDIIRIFSNRNVEKIIKVVHKSGGITVLAHPCCCPCLSLNWFFNKLKKAGLDGIEAFYPYKRHRAIIRFHSSKKAFELAKKYDFLITSGTDKH